MSVLEDQEVLVVGGSSRIGLAAAQAAAAPGAAVPLPKHQRFIKIKVSP
jgi:NAD(P)-dependent dehydrogenase (short-subunit alcohol dehydrogenase family)